MSPTAAIGASRRTVLKTLGAAALASGLRAGQAIAQTHPKRFDEAMRWIQLAFTEDDPGRYDPTFWLDFFKATRSEAVCLSAGGSIAFYPSNVPFHHRARDLGDHDIFGEMVTGSRQLNMAVVARLDPHALSQEAFNAHPQWAARTPDGQPKRHPTANDLYIACLNGPFMSVFMPQVISEIAERYDVDGFFGNRWGGSGVCYCDSCKSLFKQATGFDVPATLSGDYTMPEPGSAGEAACRAYLLWHNDMRFTQLKLWNDTAKTEKPDLFFVGGPVGGLDLDPNRLTTYAPILFGDHQARSGVNPVWNNGRYAKQMRGVMRTKPIVGIFSIGEEENYRWKDSVQSTAEIETWLADGIAQGFRPWMTKFNAKPYDTRWKPVVTERYDWLAERATYLRNTANLARVAIVYSPETACFYGRSQVRARVDDYLSGYYQALIESRIPFEMIDSRQLDAAHIDGFRVLVLPNIAILSEAQCQQLRAYVSRGGRIVATHETSLYDETGARRPNFALADLFGCNFAGQVDERVQNAYLTVRGPHPLVQGLEDTPRIISTVKRVHVAPAERLIEPLTLVQSYADLPMERVFTDTPQTDIPMVFCRTLGAGRVVYFPMDIDRTFWEILSPDHLLLLGNAVRWAADEPALVTIDGHGVLDIAVWRQAQSVTVHLVNLTNPMMMKGPIREIFPTGPFEVSFALPKGQTVSAVRLLEGNQSLSAHVEGGRLKITIPSIVLHEIVAVDLS